MEQFISSGKNGWKYDAVPFVKTDPVELGRLGRLVPGSQSRRPCVRQWHEWDFCKWYNLSRSFRLKRKKRNSFEGIPCYSGKFLPGWTVPFDISSEKTVRFHTELIQWIYLTVYCAPRATVKATNSLLYLIITRWNRLSKCQREVWFSALFHVRHCSRWGRKWRHPTILL